MTAFTILLMKQKKTRRPSIRVNFLLPADLADRLGEIQKEVGLDRSNAIKHLIAIYELKKERKAPITRELRGRDDDS
jgi:uncharacterized Fe-S cluster-containing radical SAM superfamily protein